MSAIERSGEAGRRRIAGYTLMLTLLIGGFQAFGLASALQNIGSLVPEPGAWFVLSATASMLGGVFFVVWLSEQITRHGIGNGLALILSVGIVASIPGEVANMLELVRQGAVSANAMLLYAILWAALVPSSCWSRTRGEMCRCNMPHGRREARLLAARASMLPIKLNNAGFLIPLTVAPWIFFLPLALATLVFGQTPWLRAAYAHMEFGQTAHVILGAIAVFVLAFIYTAYVLDPERAAETLREQGGSIPDVAPGDADRRPSRSRGDTDHHDRSHLPRCPVDDSGSPGGRRCAGPQ